MPSGVTTDPAIDVVQDVSVLAEQRVLDRPQDGIGRAVTETVTELLRNERITLSLTTACSHDPAGSALIAEAVCRRFAWAAPVEDPYRRRLPATAHARAYTAFRSGSRAPVAFWACGNPW